MAESKENNHIHKCAWCSNPIDKDQDYFGFGAKASPDIKLRDKTGQFVSLHLSLQDKTIFALVPDKSLVDGLGGHDLLFITCSEYCANNLKEALDLERDVFSNQ
jgi:hypothetical protein